MHINGPARCALLAPWSPYSCWAAKKQRTPEDCGGPAEVGVIVARPAPIGITSELPGRLEAYRQAEVRARVAGIVTVACTRKARTSAPAPCCSRSTRRP